MHFAAWVVPSTPESTKNSKHFSNTSSHDSWESARKPHWADHYHEILHFILLNETMLPCHMYPDITGAEIPGVTYQTLLIQLNSWCCVTINAQTLSLFCSTGSNGTQFSLTLSVCMCSPPRLVPFQCSFNSWCSSLVPRKSHYETILFGKVTWNLKHSWRFLKLSSQRTPHSVVRSSRSWDLGMVSCWIFESQRFVLLNRHERFIFCYQKPSSIYKEETLRRMHAVVSTVL